MAGRLGKCLAAVALAFSALTMTAASLPSPASATPLITACPPYGPCVTVTVTVTVSPGSGPAGATITITVTVHGLTVDTFTLVFHSSGTTLGTVSTGANGVGTGTFTVPANAAVGTHTITATDAAGNTGSTSFTVTAVSTAVAPSSSLPFTGADIAGITVGAAAAIGTGGLLLLGARRRRRSAWTSSGL